MDTKIIQLGNIPVKDLQIGDIQYYQNGTWYCERVLSRIRTMKNGEIGIRWYEMDTAFDMEYICSPDQIWRSVYRCPDTVIPAMVDPVAITYKLFPKWVKLKLDLPEMFNSVGKPSKYSSLKFDEWYANGNTILRNISNLWFDAELYPEYIKKAWNRIVTKKQKQ